MESPVTVVKQNLSIGKIIGFAVLAIVVFAILDFTGLTNWLLFPVTTAKAKFSKSTTAGS